MSQKPRDRRRDASETKLIAPDTKPRRILLVEDNPDILDMMATALRGQGYQIDHATLPEQGLGLLRQSSYDLVVTHYNLPGKTGADMLREAASLGLLKDTPTLVVTAHPDPQGVDPSRVVRKPLDVTKFLLQIEKIFATAGDPAPRPERRTAPASAGAPGTIVPVELVLYVNRVWVTSTRARQNLEKVLESFVRSQVHLLVYDVAEQALAAEEDHVVFTPTLVKRSPPPRAWVVGDLSELSVVEGLLDMSGVQRSSK
jgi:DNA-binding response OmpR family regulator